MKKIFFPVLLAIAAVSVFMAGCGKSGGTIYLEDKLAGEYHGEHKLNLAPAVVSFIEGVLGEPLPEFLDTIYINPGSAGDNQIELYSKLLELSVTGTMTADNRFRVLKTSFAELLLGPITVNNASVRTLRDVSITSGNGEIGTTVIVELQLEGAIDGLPGTLTVSTKPATFTKVSFDTAP